MTEAAVRTQTGQRCEPGSAVPAHQYVSGAAPYLRTGATGGVTPLRLSVECQWTDAVAVPCASAAMSQAGPSHLCSC
eukprot:5500878-Pyramimonas_sp.AAC.1